MRLLCATLSCALLLFGLGAAAAAQQSAASPTPSTSRVRTDLKTFLLKGLRVTQPEQRAFVDRVVELVDQGKLPERFVKSIFNWARRRNPFVPFPYFERALQLVGARYGFRI